MKTTKVHMDSLHFDHRLWNNQLKFYKDELQIFTTRLAEVSAANTDPVVKARVEQFQNRFILQQSAIDGIIKHIASHEAHLADAAKQNPVASDHMLFTNHHDMQNDVKTTTEIHENLKTEFTRFLADNL